MRIKYSMNILHILLCIQLDRKYSARKKKYKTNVLKRFN